MYCNNPRRREIKSSNYKDLYYKNYHSQNIDKLSQKFSLTLLSVIILLLSYLYYYQRTKDYIYHCPAMSKD